MDISSGCGSGASRVASFVPAVWLLPFLLLSTDTPAAIDSGTAPSFFLSVSSGVYRPSDATFYLKRINETGVADVAITYGIPGDAPITGDWDGDGINTIGVYRDGVFFLRNANTPGPADLVFAFGLPADTPIAGDWTGKGYDSVGVYGPAESVFYLRNSNTSGYADAVVPYGIPGDQPVVGDWDNNGTATVGIYRGNEFFVPIADQVRYFWLGAMGDIPLAGNWGLPQGGGGGTASGGDLLWARQAEVKRFR